MKTLLKAIILIVLLTLTTSALPQTTYAQGGDRIVFDHLNTEDGLSYRGINGITQDDQGFIWIATSEGLNRYDGVGFKVYKHDRTDSTSISRNHVEVVLQDNQNPDIFWVATQDGLNKFDRRSETFTRYLHNPDDPNSVGGNNIYELAQDSAGILWIGMEDEGLDRFDPATETFTHYRHNPDDPTSLSGDEIQVLFLDQSDTLWIGDAAEGLNRFDRATETFTRYRHDPDNPNSLSSDRIEAIAQNRDGSYWIGTSDGGLNHFDPNATGGGAFTHYRHDPDNPNSLSSDNIQWWQM